MTALLLIATVTGVLYGLWTLLGVTFDLIDQWHASARESREATSPTMEKDRSELS